MTNPPGSSPESPSAIRGLLRFLERGVLLVAGSVGLGAWVLMAARWFSDFHPAFELATHTSFHVFVSCLGLLVAEAILYRFRRGSLNSGSRWRRRLVFTAVPLLFFTWIVEPWKLLPLTAPGKGTPSLKILAWNVLLINHETSEVVELIQREKPDLVALIEVSPVLGEHLKTLDEAYPYQLSKAAWHAGGMVLLSRIPETKFDLIYPGQSWMPAIAAQLSLVSEDGDTNRVNVLSVHTLSPKPVDGSRTAVRNKQLGSLAEWSNQQSSPNMIVGDLNISPWSPPFWKLLKEGNLKDSTNYRGYFSSWPAGLGRLGIPIDHALLSPQLEVIERRNLYFSDNSDHCPVIVTIGWKKENE
jgi:endonuclease/exonuclease/phosphatase (EEP) superfamily protein YafD